MLKVTAKHNHEKLEKVVEKVKKVQEFEDLKRVRTLTVMFVNELVDLSILKINASVRICISH